MVVRLRTGDTTSGLADERRFAPTELIGVI
jgi:hypothetical protein